MGRYICAYCGSTNVRVQDKVIRCTQCNRTLQQKGEEMSINSGKWMKREKKVVAPEHGEVPGIEEQVDRKKETRVREIPEVKSR